MKLFNDVKDFKAVWTKEYHMAFFIHYRPSGELIKVVNAYGEEVLYKEGKSNKRKRGIRKVNETGS